ncbi:Aste57867_21915 [Aphanomyces stellatus]|uniref:Aste57867_21915 protein n=1 Tax=Aphanomyces stellatus TaxID=120398 RepID=A0A485LIT7_9STRA|nr:hypothetical protein As57867_021846 [Aphanomyces stellatus]VFT98583.1 Aste57867_21915 [Aphanomyces stellatus]
MVKFDWLIHQPENLLKYVFVSGAHTEDHLALFAEMASKEELVARKNDREEQLRLVYSTIEAFVPKYENAMKTLEKHLQNNMTADAVGQWFDLYLRVVDLAVEIRRGEIRHRTARKFKYRARTNTVHANATTTGLGIDDGNALINELDKIYRQLKKRKPMHLDMIESQLDIFDRDTIGPLDKRIMECKRRMESSSSAYYTTCSVTVHGDLHVELIVRQGNTILVQKQRRCVDIPSCTCDADAEPWVDFCIQETKTTPMPKPAQIVATVPDVNLNELKKSFGVDVEERERNLEAFQNEVHGDVTVTADEPVSKRRCVSLTIPNGVIQDDTAVLDAILSSVKPAPTGVCNVHYGSLQWGETPEYDRMDKVAAALVAHRVETWTMQDMAPTAVEMTSFAAILTEKGCLRQLMHLNLRGLNVKPATWTLPLHAIATLPSLVHLDLSYNTLAMHGPAIESILTKCLKLTTVNLEQCRLRNAETNLLGGLKACAKQLQRLSLADNAFSRPFLKEFVQLDLELDTLNLRYLVVEETEHTTSNDETAMEMAPLRARHLHLDFSSLVEDASLLGSLAAALSSPTCRLRSLDMSSFSSPPEPHLSELLMQISKYGQLQRLSLRGIASIHMSLWSDLLQKGLPRCVVLEWTLPESSIALCITWLQAAHLPALREVHLSVEASSSFSDDVISDWRERLVRQLPKVSKLDIVPVIPAEF